jgi:lactoylglutathione lyase
MVDVGAWFDEIDGVTKSGLTNGWASRDEGCISVLAERGRRGGRRGSPDPREGSLKGITGVGHVAIKVSDLARSLDYYVNKLGFPEMMRLHKDDGSVWLVYLRVTDEQYLEVFPGADGPRAPGWDANGINHLCLTVDDIDAVLAQVEAAGLSLLLPLKTAIDGNRQAWLEDPDGNRIELMEMAADSLQYKAIKRLRAERVLV